MSNRFNAVFCATSALAAMTAILAGCGATAQPDSAGSVPATTAPAVVSSETQATPAPAVAAADTAPKSDEPPLAQMKAAIPSAKISVPVDLRYSFGSSVLPNQPVTLNLAAVPRVTGTNLKVSLKPGAAVRVDAGALAVQKASVAGVYRQQLSVTRLNGSAASIRVLVTMDMPEGTAFGYFSIPLDDETASQKQDSVKQR